MNVSTQDRDAMMRLMKIMNGEAAPTQNESLSGASASPVELAGAGQVTSRDIQAMAQVLNKLNAVMESTHQHMWEQGAQDPEMAEALITEKQADHVKIGQYKIRVQEDAHRVAGKQYYSVVNVVTGDTLAHELSLYEAAHGLVRMLNRGMWINSPKVRELLEAEAAYTGHRVDAIRYHRMLQKLTESVSNQSKRELYETRKQVSLDKSMQAKKLIKKIYAEL